MHTYLHLIKFHHILIIDNISSIFIWIKKLDFDKFLEGQTALNYKLVCKRRQNIDE